MNEKNEWTKKNEQMNEKMNEEWKPILIYWLIEKWMKNSDGIERNNSQKMNETIHKIWMNIWPWKVKWMEQLIKHEWTVCHEK